MADTSAYRPDASAYRADANAYGEGSLDLEAIEANVGEADSYSYVDAQRDVRTLLAAVRHLEEQRAAVARLIDLAIEHGASPLAVDRLEDALAELRRPRELSSPPAADSAPPAGTSAPAAKPSAPAARTER
jgi:hypothetical protein